MKREDSCPWSKSQQGAVPGSKLIGLKAGVLHPHLLQDPWWLTSQTISLHAQSPPWLPMSQGKSLPWLSLSPIPHSLSFSHSLPPRSL